MPESLVPASSDSNPLDADYRRLRSKDKYLPGAIRRIALHNFLTYEDVEFQVGPYLNLICGPNGTGKSSIACAIALGLGGHPNLLGRASHVGSFVKRGETDAWIEIELQSYPDSVNPIIRRTLKVDTGKSEWVVNGEIKIRADVLALVATYNIDVSNLCSFLPQDRVHEFAKMTDAKRLVETEKAVGGIKLVQWHEKLNNYGKMATDIAGKLETVKTEKAHLEQLIQAHQVDIERFEERQQIEERIEKLKVMIAMAEYNQSKHDVSELQKERDAKRQQLAEVHQRGEPLRAKRGELDEKSLKLRLELDRLDKTFAEDEKRRKVLVRGRRRART